MTEESFKAAELKGTVKTRKGLEIQMNENKILKDELRSLKSEAVVYQSLGPMLIKTDLEKVKRNVNKKIHFLNKELKRVDDRIETLEQDADNL